MQPVLILWVTYPSIWPTALDHRPLLFEFIGLLNYLAAKVALTRLFLLSQLWGPKLSFPQKIISSLPSNAHQAISSLLNLQHESFNILHFPIERTVLRAREQFTYWVKSIQWKTPLMFLSHPKKKLPSSVVVVDLAFTGLQSTQVS